MTALPAPIALALPLDLARALRIYDHRRAAGEPADVDHHADAARIAAEIRAAIRPTTIAIVGAWLTDLATGPQLPKDGPSLKARIGAVFGACSDFPASVWNTATLTRALRTFRWFPTPADVYDLLKPEADKVTALLAGLDAIARAPKAVVAREAAAPYVPPAPPEWVHDRRIRGPSGRGRPDLDIQPPRYTPEQQIAILTGKTAA